MAKRRRLDPTSPMEIALATHVDPGGLETKSMGRTAPPPIAQVTGEAASIAAADAALGAIEKARQEGRMVVSLPITAISRDHLTRDRLRAHDEDMEALIASLKAHGQRTPIEVVKTDQGYGLISGWRRLAALEALEATHVDALIRTPKDAGEAYVAMVEENEIRAGLSYYERARIAAMAAARGAFEDTEAALSALYGNVSRAKRSKIRSFVSLFEALDDKLQFPDAIPERLGLKIAGALKAGKLMALKKALSSKAASAEAEMDRLTQALSDQRPKAAPTKEQLAPDIEMEIKGTGKNMRLTLSGSGLTDETIARIKTVLKS